MLIPLGMAKWCIPFWVTLTLTLTYGLISRFLCLEHISYITASFPQMCLMLDQFLWGHSSRDCDISCFLFVWFYQHGVSRCAYFDGYQIVAVSFIAEFSFPFCCVVLT